MADAKGIPARQPFFGAGPLIPRAFRVGERCGGLDYSPTARNLAAVAQLHPLSWLNQAARADRRAIGQQRRQVNNAGEGLSYSRLSSYGAPRVKPG
jgi:hypothetical protein